MAHTLAILCRGRKMYFMSEFKRNLAIATAATAIGIGNIVLGETVMEDRFKDDVQECLQQEPTPEAQANCINDLESPGFWKGTGTIIGLAGLYLGATTVRRRFPPSQLQAKEIRPNDYKKL